MQQESDSGDAGKGARPKKPEPETRPQQAGEAGTTRLGMEDGDNTDVPATGGPAPDDGGDNPS